MRNSQIVVIAAFGAALMAGVGTTVRAQAPPAPGAPAPGSPVVPNPTYVTIPLEIDVLTAVFAPDGEFLALYRPEGDRARPAAVFVG